MRFRAFGRRVVPRAIVVLLAVLALLMVGAPAAFAAGEQVQGRLVDGSGNPVAGVVLVASKQGGDAGDARSGKDGRWVIPLTEPGTYDVAIRTDTLPSGIGIREGTPDHRTVDIAEGETKNVLFSLGEAAQSGTSWLGSLAQHLLDGIRFGALIGVTAVGLSLIFGATRLINFAHGELVTLGAVSAWVLNASGLHLLLAAAVSVVLVGAFSGALELGLWRPMRRRGVGLVSMFIASIGVALILRQLILMFFGGAPRSYAQYSLQRAITVGPFSITPRDGIILVLSLAVLSAVALMLTKTRIGTKIRAVADNRVLAEASGIDSERIGVLVWVLGGGLAAAGGIFYGLQELVSWTMGLNLLLLMFAAVILGGLGSAFGAFIGAMVIGILAQVSTMFFDSELQVVWALGLMILTLLVRPQGILGKRERVG
ncbi:MAG: branched-chain amino acid ABC transporter permease [Terrimesophilobacter sp.]